MSYLKFKKEISFGESITKVFNPKKEYLGYIKEDGKGGYIYLPNQNTSYELGCLIEIKNVIQKESKRGLKNV